MFRRYILIFSILMFCGSLSVTGEPQEIQAGLEMRVQETQDPQPPDMSEFMKLEPVLPKEVMIMLNARPQPRSVLIKSALWGFVKRNTVPLVASVAATCGTIYGNLPLEYISLAIAIASLREDIGTQNLVAIFGCLAVSFSGACTGNMWMKYTPALPSYYFAREWFMSEYDAAKASARAA